MASRDASRGNSSKTSRSDLTRRLLCWRFPHNPGSGLRFVYFLLRFFLFAFWCVFVSHGYSLPRIAKLG